MASIQLALNDENMAGSLRGLLTRNTDLPVRCVQCPDLDDSGVLVVDLNHLHQLKTPLLHPERVVLIAPKEIGTLENAWQAGVNSVLSEKDPLNTMVLAILSACLRTDSTPAKRS